MNRELLQNIRVIDPISKIDRTADILITENQIAAIQENITEIPADTEVRDCRGLILGPGLADIYSHSGEPGFEERETLESLMQAAAAGGFTRLAILPDTSPPVDNLAGLALLQQHIRNLSPSLPRLYFWGALTAGVKGQQMAELGELASSPIVGFADGFPLSNPALVRRLLEYIQPLHKSIALWPCDRTLAGNGAAREGAVSVRLGLPGIPASAETSALAAILELVASGGTRVHIMRVSTARSVELIRDAKARDLPVTASVTWMHLLLNVGAISGNSQDSAGKNALTASVPYDPNLHLEPPLGNLSDQLALIQAVKDGVIDAIAIDHNPRTYEEKTVAFADSPPGAIGLELALPLLWHGLVETGEFSALELWRVLSTGPAVCLGQTPAKVALGASAELILFDPLMTWTVEGRSLKSRSANTPWLGQQIAGKVLQTWV
ncbi:MULTISPECIES: dihydroorotase [unclassified Microcoleus]|uniref:dihydroorotase n=1 Tax=unclassified Microcoleus TaxID=2642155 RepID=UPI001DA4F8C1|nr:MULTISPECIES: dihydroorotase [unclassified Microcoleus]MCC3508022.1 dihydroorotase [Microcoleus sp. PH2017_17_BER_D_A]TAE66547.1 MAG: dihydroorotase [Oscillatoriales cyanobacterium]MCC3411910.1 dihydroorotase [Microcoleus sp. PH2017_02_FOX_O_A]MCC3437098.1 dihydroorotase [Microcoleus sp. PH2017_05_CCC_O_A]MCC3517392.1 dihydroorotase [Microcoleus sp. PH2017_18_LLB_O_A]